MATQTVIGTCACIGSIASYRYHTYIPSARYVSMQGYITLIPFFFVARSILIC